MARSRRNEMLVPAALAVTHALLFLLSYWLLTSVPGPPATHSISCSPAST